MAYIVPSSKIVFTDFMILLVSVLMGLNSVMSFEEKEGSLPPVKLPQVSEAHSRIGHSEMKKPTITVRSGLNGLVYFYNDETITLEALPSCLKRAGTSAVILRGDRETPFQWETFCKLTAILRDAGVKEIQYAVNTENGGTS